MKDADKARQLFESFHGRPPEGHDEIARTKASKGEVVLRVGDLKSVIYITEDGEYIHDFKATDRPGLYVSSDGQQAFIVAGRYVFTDRGFID